MNRIIILVIFLIPAAANAEPIVLKDETEIQRAQLLKQSIGEISNKVMACMKEPGASAEFCGCANLETCKFKKEFEAATILYCAIKADYPSWQGNVVKYHIEDERQSHDISLPIKGMDLQYGRYCK